MPLQKTSRFALSSQLQKNDASRRRWLRGALFIPLSLLPMRSVFAFTFWFTSKSMEDWPELKRRIREKFSRVQHLSTEQLAERLKSAPNALILLDTRSAAEYAVSRIANAMHAPDVAAAQAVLAQHAGKTAVLYCSVGYRSAALVEKLQELSAASVSAQVFNLEGSMFEWANQGRAVALSTKVHPFNKAWSGLLKRDLWAHQP